ncbi:MAG: hypothetical protein ACON46_03730 [Coraliomargaritaceae bacterium]
MNDCEFKELVDLYLDKEIDGESMQRLMEAIDSSQSRRRKFDSACQLHHAMRVALGKEVAANEARNPLPLRRWQVGLAMFASFICGAFFLAPAFHQSDRLESISAELSEPLDSSNNESVMKALPSSIQRYLSRSSSSEADRSHSSLAARLRLAGLSPDLAPKDARLQAVEIRSQNVSLTWNEQFGGWQVHRNSSAVYLSAQPGTHSLEGSEKIFFSDVPRRGQFEETERQRTAFSTFQFDTRRIGWQGK